MPSSAPSRLRPALPLVAAIAICAYGAVLRMNALTTRYGAVQHPAWARVLSDLAPVARRLQPAGYVWWPEPNPYVGGDPVNYLRFAREMKSFYQAHVREPVFLALTRGFLVLLGGQDVAVSFASAAMSTLAIFGIYLLGRAAFSAPVGLLAALGFAIDYDAVSWAPDGWRDDTFTCLLVFTLVAIVRLRQEPTTPRMLLAGILGAAACLTRITAVSWLIPALLLVPFGFARGEERRRRVGAAAGAAVVSAALVAPYLINCARVLGDPLIAVNAHTVYYRAGEGADHGKPMSAARYITQKVVHRPVEQADVALTGVFVWPMQNKWSGFNFWVPHLATALEAAAIVGLLLFLGTPVGLLLLVVVVSSLLPYAFTWNIAGGGEWRFTMHVYPLYLLAASYAVDRLARAAWGLRKPPNWKAFWRWRYLALASAAIVGAVGAYAGYRVLPYFVEREALAAGDPVTISTGWRDEVFYTSGWSGWRRDGAVTSRVATGDRGSIRFALPQQRSYRMTIRVDPVTPDAPRVLTLLLNGRLLHRFELQFDPQRVGSHTVDVPAEFVSAGATVLTLVADSTVPAGAAGQRYGWLHPSTPVSIRVWYVRIHRL